MHSLGTEEISAEQTDGVTFWRPQTPDVEMRAVPAASSPGDSPAARLAQMREMIGQLKVYDVFQEASEWPLRPLREPLCRYGDPQTQVLDGAIFPFLLGINPEAVVLLEARRRGAGARPGRSHVPHRRSGGMLEQ